MESGAQLGAALAVAEQAIRTPEIPGDRLVELSRVQQLAYLKLADHQDWLPQVLEAVPAELRAAVKNNYDAMAGIAVLNPPLSSPPTWHVVAAPPPEQLRAYYKEAETVFGIPWYYLAAIHLIETAFSRIDSDSTAGAQGPMQFIPSTWASYGQGDIHNTHDAILAAGRYLRASGGPGNMSRAVYSYNPDQHYVTAVTAYANNMKADERAFLGYYNWRVYVVTKTGPVFLDPKT
jgi:soluble lytic murein transglycosylase-like protein